MPSLLTVVAGTVAFLSGSTLLAAQVTDSTTGRTRTIALPAIGSAPETGLQFGATVLSVREFPQKEQRRPATVQVTAIRTVKGQVRVSLDAERWTVNNRWRMALNSAWQRFPLAYFGIGADTPESARELYSPSGFETTITVQRRLTRSLFAVIAPRVVSTRIAAPDSTGALHTSAIVGSSGGRTVEIATGLLADTRDNLFAPRNGQFTQVQVARANDAIGSDFTYTRMRADARLYRSIGAHTFAAHALVHGTTPGASFDQMPLVGSSDIMRGYARGRYRDRWLAASQVEYRSPYATRVGGVLFAGAGTVDSTVSGLASSRLLATYGAGARVLLDRRQRTAVRVDYARGSSGARGLYIGFNQAF